MSISIIAEKCKGCGLCIKACPYDGIYMESKLAKLNDKCTFCGACVASCKFGAILQEEQKSLRKIDVSQYKGVWVFAEQRQNKITPVVLELLGEGKKLATEIGTHLAAVLIGNDCRPLAAELVAFGAEKVYMVQDPLLAQYTTDGYTKIIADLIEQYKPESVLFGATHIGRDLAPRIAARVGTGLTADCTKLDIDPADKKIMQTRPAFGGNLMATIVCPNHRPQMSTVRPGVMQKLERDPNRRGDIIDVMAGITAKDIRTNVVDVVKTLTEMVSLTEADIIVSGGRGLGTPDGFKLIKQFADKLGGAVGSSRAAVDAGWIDHSHQVGQTGTTVKPTIYFACGISGAIQHLAGMSGADIIVAINKNENAPIFEVADFGIVGDLYDVIPEIMNALSLLQTGVVNALWGIDSDAPDAEESYR